MKNKKKAEDTKIVFIKKLISRELIINPDNKNEIIKKESRYNLFLKSDFIHFNLGPTAIAIKNGMRNGNINLL